MPEAAIIATDLAQVIGLYLLFGIPLTIGVFIMAADVLLTLCLQCRGFRGIETLVIALLEVITAGFAIQIALPTRSGAKSWSVPPVADTAGNPNLLYLTLGIIGRW